MYVQKPIYLPCRLCERPARIPPAFTTGDHNHYQVCCFDCGIEVSGTDEAETSDIWNRLMAPINGAEKSTNG